MLVGGKAFEALSEGLITLALELKAGDLQQLTPIVMGKLEKDGTPLCDVG